MKRVDTAHKVVRVTVAVEEEERRFLVRTAGERTIAEARPVSVSEVARELFARAMAETKGEGSAA